MTGKSIVAIVGRQNVGKSTLLNRLAGRRIAIVEDMPGTTRDRVFAEVSWQGDEFTLVDTGGLEISPDSTIGRGVREQVGLAVEEADAIIFMVDVRDGVTTPDREAADLVRRSGKPVIVAANKADNERLETHAIEFHELGLGEPLPISAHHARGTAELLDRLMPLIPPPPPDTTGDEMLKVAIVGRPNVGKSMLLNSFLGSERVIVDDTPGTTRDAIDTVLDVDGQSVLIIDTAGMRRRGKLGVGIERYSVMRALRAIDRADVALLVLDASEGVTAQDTHVAGYVQQAYRKMACIRMPSFSSSTFHGLVLPMPRFSFETTSASRIKAMISLSVQEGCGLPSGPQKNSGVCAVTSSTSTVSSTRGLSRVK